MVTILLLAAATLASEDLTCISAGLLIRRGDLHWGLAIGGCLLGIYVGDLGLFVLGRLLGGSLMRWRWFASRVSPAKLDNLGTWFDQHAATSIFAARFLPGTRLPLYLAAGALGKKGGRFAFWTFIAAIVWTPAIVLLAAFLGEAFASPARGLLGAGWAPFAVSALFMLMMTRLAMRLMTPLGRARLIARLSCLMQWEFWPIWLFYPPVGLWIAWLSIRWRGFTTITAANPGIMHGGFVGESKSQIMSALGGGAHVSPTISIAPGELRQRIDGVTGLGWKWPIILKPDAGQRGAGVKLVHDPDEARRYLDANAAAVIAQPYHPGPFEAGIFYYRYPGEARGRIFSITDKQFPVLVGDGVSSLEELIWRHKRFRMQAATFLARHAAERQLVLACGEHFRLAVAGNHCQGTLFRDGAHLLTPALERAIDQVARRFDGFYFGRFDVRYSDVERFKAGKDFLVIELNGITSESTNVYDPSWSLLRAYRTLFAQWAILFRIGAMNRRLGQRGSSLFSLFRDVIGYYRAQRPQALAD